MANARKVMTPPTILKVVLRNKSEAERLRDAAELARARSLSSWLRAVAIHEAERLEASQPGVGQALETVRTHLSSLMGEGDGNVRRS
jgi:hypothetical protein